VPKRGEKKLDSRQEIQEITSEHPERSERKVYLLRRPYLLLLGEKRVVSKSTIEIGNKEPGRKLFASRKNATDTSKGGGRKFRGKSRQNLTSRR